MIFPKNHLPSYSVAKQINVIFILVTLQKTVAMLNERILKKKLIPSIKCAANAVYKPRNIPCLFVCLKFIYFERKES